MYRYLLINTSSYIQPKYKKIKKLYEENIKEAHKRFLKFKTKYIKQNNNDEHIFYVNLIGFDGTVKNTFRNINKSTFSTIFKIIDDMPLGYLRPSKTLKNKNSNILDKNYYRGKKENIKTKNLKGLSLYADYNPKTTLKGTGFKDAKTAKQTLKLIKNRDLTYQKQVINTMYNRAKFHPHQTPQMREAMTVFKEWLSQYKN